VALPDVLALDAVSGSGKTFLALSVGAEHHKAEIARLGYRTPEGHLRMPTCYLTLPESSGTAKLNGRALRFLQDVPPARNETVDAQTMRIVGLMKRCGVTLLILDDADNLIFHPKQTPFLRDFLNQSGTSVLLVGFARRERGLFTGRSS
jgi:hypothetical protein